MNARTIWKRTDADGPKPHALEHVFDLDGTRFRVQVKRDTYKQQSFGVINVWVDGAGWQLLATAGYGAAFKQEVDYTSAQLMAAAGRWVKGVTE